MLKIHSHNVLVLIRRCHLESWPLHLGHTSITWNVVESSKSYCWWFRNPANQLRFGSLSHYLQGFVIAVIWLFECILFAFIDLSKCTTSLTHIGTNPWFSLIHVAKTIPPVPSEVLNRPTVTTAGQRVGFRWMGATLVTHGNPVMLGRFHVEAKLSFRRS